MRIEFAQGARTEFRVAAQWYVRQAGPAVAHLFRNEMRTMLDMLAEHPVIGAPTVGGARFVVLKRFPFSVVYRQAGMFWSFSPLRTTGDGRDIGWSGD